MRRYLTLLLILLWTHPLVSTAGKQGITVPLHYHPQYGIYTTTISVGVQQPQKIEAIVDSGSSALVLVADKTFCPSCGAALTTGAINPVPIKKNGSSKLIPFYYGSANDLVEEYNLPIQLDNQQSDSVDMKFFLLKNSTQPSSIIGMIPHDLRENQVKFIPFLTKLTNRFDKYSELTFVLCGDQGKSYFHLGKYPLPNTSFTSPLNDSEFYEINTSGFYDQNNEPIAKPDSPSATAILDTGTGGFIVLTPHLYKPLFDYIYKHAGPKNQNLDPKFWRNNYCIRTQDVDFTALPPIKIGFKALNKDDDYYLTIPPTTYLNQGGCGVGYVRLVFNPDFPPTHPTAVRNSKLRNKAQAIPDMVIGTSLLDHYALQIHYSKKPYVTFYDNTELCSKDRH